MPRPRRGSKIAHHMLYAVLAYVSWGFIPAYLKLLSHLPVSMALTHRSLWAGVFFTVLLKISKGRWSDFLHLTLNQRLFTFVSSALLGLNWGIYLYAINTNQVVEGSLGYFINPLINFLLGFIFLGERLPPLRKISVTLATLGVLWLTFWAGSFPWIGMSLGLTFGLYGLIRKISKVDPASALQVESIVLALAMWFIFMATHPDGSALPATPADALLLIGAGMVTGLPLLWFSKGAQILPMNVLGFLQFISPTFQFLLGVYIYNEPFPPEKLVGFVFIWLGVLLLILELLFSSRRRSA